MGSSGPARAAIARPRNGSRDRSAWASAAVAGPVRAPSAAPGHAGRSRADVLSVLPKINLLFPEDGWSSSAVVLQHLQLRQMPLLILIILTHFRRLGNRSDVSSLPAREMITSFRYAGRRPVSVLFLEAVQGRVISV